MTHTSIGFISHLFKKKHLSFYLISRKFILLICKVQSRHWLFFHAFPCNFINFIRFRLDQRVEIYSLYKHIFHICVTLFCWLKTYSVDSDVYRPKLHLLLFLCVCLCVCLFVCFSLSLLLVFHSFISLSFYTYFFVGGGEMNFLSGFGTFISPSRFFVRYL